jgi:LemA protein
MSIEQMMYYGIGLSIVGAGVGVGMVVIVIYNRLIALRNRYKNAFAQIDVYLKRRYDLIPNLVETAKGYLKHERGTLEAVIKARAAATQAVVNIQAGKAKDMAKLAKADATLTAALGRLLVAFEKYPDLKANQNILRIQDELTSTENVLAQVRQTFNDSVTTYNTQREVFPDVLLAGTFGFVEAGLMELDNPDERIAPKVAF